MQETIKRNYQLDNAKAILIFLVVFGHIIETNLADGINRTVYLLIYSFHMPFFAYITGYFTKPTIKKIIVKFLIPYVLFQTLYIVFECFVLGNKVPFQYIKPYWILWYLVAVIWWNLFLMIFKKCNIKKQNIILLLSILLALLCGYVKGIGREWALARTLVFLPYFLWGYLVKTRKTKEMKKVFIAIAASLFVLIYFLQMNFLKVSWFYEATSYITGKYSILFRTYHMAGAFFIILFLRIILPNKYVKGVTYIGKNTMPTYLLHGFAIKWIGTFNPIIACGTIFTLVWLLPVIFQYFTCSKNLFPKNDKKKDKYT